jgi:hypothetical protein
VGIISQSSSCNCPMSGADPFEFPLFALEN